MLVSILVLSVTVFTQGGPIQTVAAARRDQPTRSATSVDSARALRSAHRAQESFEFTRKLYLPREAGVGSHHCDVRVGRWCVWNDETNDRKPPAENPHIVQARAKLLALLDSTAARFPGDEWVAAQEVRYLIEAKRFGDATRVADRCIAGGSSYRCRAFGAVALHDSGAVAAADSAFSDALAAMPDSVRCKWMDISLLLDDEFGDRYARGDCAARQRMATTFWRLTTPLYLRNGDYRNEFLARVAHGEMERDSRTPMGATGESAFRETALRYGYDTWFVRDDPPAGSMAEAPIAGYREGGSGYNFVPAWAVFTSPVDLHPEDWNFKERTARTLYGPAYARHFVSMPTPQIALFRRGDSALVVAWYDVRDEALFGRHNLVAGLFTVPVDSDKLGQPHGTIDSTARRSGLLMTTAPWSRMIVSVELLDSEYRSAARARFGMRPPAGDGSLSISDLLLFAPSSADSLPRRLEDALPLALHTDELDRSRALGLYWEMSGVHPGESFAVSIGVNRVQDGLIRRAAERLHLATPFSPVKLQWTELPNTRDGIVSRSVTLDLSKLEPGRYEIVLNVSSMSGLPLIAKREVTIRR